MKGILVTQGLKDKNIELFQKDTVNSIVQKQIPDKFHGSENINAGGYKLRLDLQTADGWKDISVPSYDPAIEKLGGLIESGSEYTYQILQKTSEEIQAETLSWNESLREQKIQDNIRIESAFEAQSLDDTNSLNNQELFPVWFEGITVVLGNKWQDFDDDNVLYLWRCEQSHETQSDWRPKDTPALWTKVAYPGQIPVWVQPTGAQDAYAIGDQVYYPTANDSVYESLIAANVYSPDAYPAGWQLIP